MLLGARHQIWPSCKKNAYSQRADAAEVILGCWIRYQRWPNPRNLNVIQQNVVLRVCRDCIFHSIPLPSLWGFSVVQLLTVSSMLSSRRWTVDVGWQPDGAALLQKAELSDGWLNWTVWLRHKTGGCIRPVRVEVEDETERRRAGVDALNPINTSWNSGLSDALCFLSRLLPQVHWPKPAAGLVYIQSSPWLNNKSGIYV